jgi:threonine/homoserine/homoserine lactone efflux protein
MLEYIFLGGGFALAAAIQPGPLQAFFLSSVAQRGWKRTLPAAFAPLISDGPIAVLALVVLNQIPPVMSKVLQIIGGIFLIYLAWGSYRQWKKDIPEDAEDDTSAPRTVIQAAMVNILNPHPYLGWSLVLGPALLSAWEKSPAYATVLVISFYGTMVVALAGTILLFGTTRYLGPRGRRTLILISAVLLALLGVYQLAAGILGIQAA